MVYHGRRPIAADVEGSVAATRASFAALGIPCLAVAEFAAG
jgi:hypothetical protein